jgi:hypothetical protein
MTLPLTLPNEPVPPDNVATLVPRQRSIHAVLVENLNSTQALLTRLESGRVRSLYVATRFKNGLGGLFSQ